MSSQEPNSPKEGDFIDLNKKDFKKKSNFIRNSFFFLILVSIGLFVGFLTSREELMNLLQLNTLPGKPESNYSQDSYIENEKNKEVEIFTQRIEEIKLNYNNLENKLQILEDRNNVLNNELSEIKKLVIQKRKNLFPEDYKNYFLFLKFKSKLIGKQDFKVELEDLFLNLSQESESYGSLNFFSSINANEITTRFELLELINNMIKVHKSDIEILIERIQYDDNLKLEKVFESKESFISYLKEIFSSTFKITKFQNNKPNEQSFDSNLVVNTLETAKEYILIGEIDEFINILGLLSIDDSDLNLLKNKAIIYEKYNDHLNRIENDILKITGNSVDKNF